MVCQAPVTHQGKILLIFKHKFVLVSPQVYTSPWSTPKSHHTIIFGSNTRSVGLASAY